MEKLLNDPQISRSHVAPMPGQRSEGRRVSKRARALSSIITRSARTASSRGPIYHSPPAQQFGDEQGDFAGGALRKRKAPAKGMLKPRGTVIRSYDPC